MIGWQDSMLHSQFSHSLETEMDDCACGKCLPLLVERCVLVIPWLSQTDCDITSQENPLRWLSFKAVCLLSYIWIETSLQGQELRLLQQPNLDPFMLLLAVNVLHVESQASTFISLLPQLCGKLNLPFHLRSACIALFKEFKSLVFDLFPKDNVIGHFVTEENRFQRNPASFSAAWVLFLRSSNLFLLEMSCESFSYLGRKGPESIRLHMF